MKISQMINVVVENYENQKNPLFFHGSPGIGKTEGIEQAATLLTKKRKKFILRTIILSQFESVDLRGLPSVENNITAWNPPADLTFEEDAEGIVFFDEMSNAAQDVQKAAQQIIHARRLGELHIPQGIVFIAAGNRQSDKAGANRLLTALANRFEHHDIEVDAEDWLKWAMEKNLDHSVIAFINWQQAMLNDFDSNRHINATPRSWKKISDLVGSSMFDDRVIGTIGPGPGAMYLGFNKVWMDLPSAEEIWKNPDKVEMPKKQDIQYATAMSLALKAAPENFANALKFMMKAGKEMQVVFIKFACNSHRAIRETTEFKAYLKANKDLLFH